MSAIVPSVSFAPPIGDLNDKNPKRPRTPDHLLSSTPTGSCAHTTGREFFNLNASSRVSDSISNDCVKPSISLVQLGNSIKDWPENAILDLAEGTWILWCEHLTLQLLTRYGSSYIAATNSNQHIPCPDIRTEPVAFANWRQSDAAICGLMMATMTRMEREYVRTCNTASDMYETLCLCHADLSVMSSVTLLAEILSFSFTEDTTLAEQYSVISTKIERFLQVAKFLRNVLQSLSLCALWDQNSSI
jgi:hypothetical protein